MENHILYKLPEPALQLNFVKERYISMVKLIVAVETHRHKCIGSIVRCASAFGASMVAVVGNMDFSTHGAHGAQIHTQFIHFYYWSELVMWCSDNQCDIVGVTNHVLTQSCVSRSVDSFDFGGRSVCFVMGDKDGLNAQQLDICSNILHVDVPNGEGLIPYDTKLAICLQQFAVQSGFVPSEYNGEKHVLGTITKKLGIIRGSKLVSQHNPEVSSEIDSEDGLADLFT